MLRYRTQGLLAAGLGLLLTGCFSDPDLKTGLRPEGSPEVLAVMAWDTAVRQEQPAFCLYDAAGVLDPKAPSLVQGVQKCPEKQADFTPAELEPLSWNIRTVFDELLDGDRAETLDCDPETDICVGHIDTTLPFEISCAGVAMPYDGYYYPNGNKESNPAGPALVLEPGELAPTDTDCIVTIKPTVVVDKDGVAVDVGPNLNTFTVHVQRLNVVETDPLDAEAVAERSVLAPNGTVSFILNSFVDGATVSATDVTLTDLDTNLAVAADVTVTDNVIDVGGAAALPAGNYAAKISAGAVIDDVVGGTRTFASELQVRFVVE